MDDVVSIRTMLHILDLEKRMELDVEEESIWTRVSSHIFASKCLS
jgi:hypothetical protein